MKCFLNQLKPGARCRVLKVEGSGAIKRRVFDMGITPGTEMCVRKIAPLGDPIELTLRGYELSLRKSEAAMIAVDLTEGGAQ